MGVSPIVGVGSGNRGALKRATPFPVRVPRFTIRVCSCPKSAMLSPFNKDFASMVTTDGFGQVNVNVRVGGSVFERDDLGGLGGGLGGGEVSRVSCRWW